MRSASPDARWRSPRFAMRRALRLPTADPAWYLPRLAQGEADAIGRGVARARRGPATAPPVRSALLVGPAPRSGTNFVEALIAAHPQVASAPCGLRELPVLSEVERLRPFANALAARHASNAGVGAEAWLGLALAGLLSRAAAEAPQAAMILIKDPHARRLDLVRAVLPDASLVVVLRDGRRTVDSGMATWPARGVRRWLGRSFADHCKDWALATEAALDLAARDPSVITLRYEDAAAAPSATAARLWAALGLEADSEAERAAAVVPVLGSSTHSRGTDGVVDWQPRARPAGFDPAGRPVRWSRRRERLFERLAGEAQERLEREAPAAMPKRAARSAETEGAEAPVTRGSQPATTG